MLVSFATLKYATQSYQKMNVIARLIRGKNVVEALDMLSFTQKKGAKIFYGLVHSAYANAKQKVGEKAETLSLSDVQVGKGPSLRRLRFTSRSRVSYYTKYRAHLRVGLS